MIRIYEYDPHESVDEEDNVTVTYAYRDFQNYLFSFPYDFKWDWSKDMVTINGIAYRISSVKHVNDDNQITCTCTCGNNGNGDSSDGGSGSSGISKVKTDHTLHGEGNNDVPLGVKLSDLAGNGLQKLEDGLYVNQPTGNNVHSIEYDLSAQLDGTKQTFTIKEEIALETIEEVYWAGQYQIRGLNYTIDTETHSLTTLFDVAPKATKGRRLVIKYRTTE